MAEQPMLMVMYEDQNEGPHSIYWKSIAEDLQEMRHEDQRVGMMLDMMESLSQMTGKPVPTPPNTIAESVRLTCKALFAMQPFSHNDDPEDNHSITAIHVYRLQEVAMVTPEGELDLTEDGSAWEVAEA